MSLDKDWYVLLEFTVVKIQDDTQFLEKNQAALTNFSVALKKLYLPYAFEMRILNALWAVVQKAYQQEILLQEEQKMMIRLKIPGGNIAPKQVDHIWGFFIVEKRTHDVPRHQVDLYLYQEGKQG